MIEKMKFRGHETFFIRKGWLRKGIKNVLNDATLFVNKDKLPTDVLGIGANMVKSLRYWLQVVGLTTEVRGEKTGKREQIITDLGKVIYKNDPYFEELGTLWLLHYNLAKNITDATSWYFFFNEFQMQEFTKDDFCLALKKFISINSKQEVADSSLEGDFDCLVNTYIARAKSNPKKVDPENNIDCPFGELNLLDIKSKKDKIYTKVIPPKASIHPLIALAIVVAQSDNAEVKIQTLLKGKNSLGKIFNLDMISLLELLNKIERLGYISVVRTAGLDVVKVKTKWTFLECVEQYYRAINNLGGE